MTGSPTRRPRPVRQCARLVIVRTTAPPVVHGFVPKATKLIRSPSGFQMTSQLWLPGWTVVGRPKRAIACARVPRPTASPPTVWSAWMTNGPAPSAEAAATSASTTARAGARRRTLGTLEPRRDVRDVRRGRDPRVDERERARAVEQPPPRAEQDRRDVEEELVHDARAEALLRDLGAAGDVDGALTRGRTGLLDRGFDAVHEGEGRIREDERLARVVRDDEDGHVERRLVAPPAVRVRIVLPWPGAAAEHPPAHDHRAGAGDRRADELAVLVLLAALEPVLRTPRGEPERPLVQRHPARAEWILERGVGPGDEAVERHRDLQQHLRHRVSSGRIQLRRREGRKLIGQGWWIQTATPPWCE